ncbi:nitroreductase [Flavitalea sp. BT771]|uniref:nitroreductase family protein n=1 Tax=Flavitalea sp. BT771 TaxID=3063329 RepID=UPI0026E43185|nr:nitroreductase [Flavitalea sp. BT771]MDO6431271.1 nitroreductase [Flavitalea sp. BT771]MDV6220179.1 nitroreductase [Flavitalea sp. BT771]
MISPLQVNQLIRLRRSTFPDQFEKDRPIDEDIIWQLLENASWAPNHKATEPWHFTVFTGEGLKKFAAFQAGRYQQTAGEKFRQDKYNKLLTNPLKASHIIAIILRRSKTADIPEIEEIAAVSCAVENIYLSATAYGLGGYWSTGGPTYDPAAGGFFGLEEGDKLMGFFYLGHVRVPSVAGSRKPVKEKTTWVTT